MNYIKNNYINWIILLLGITILGLGNSLIVIANCGSDSITIFGQGVANTLSIKYGYGYIVANLFFFIIVLIFHRKKIGIGTVASAFLTGLLINLYMEILPFSTPDNIILKYTISLSGIVVVAIGIALYMYSNTGLGSFEGVVDLLTTKTKLRFWIIKICFDLILFISGILLGGTFGPVSVLSVFTLGPLIDLFRFLLKKTNIIKEHKEENKLETEDLLS